MAEEGGNNVSIYMGGVVPQHLRDTITHIRVHKSVKIITSWVFQGCQNLMSIEIHDGVEIIEEGSFGTCTSLRGIKLSGVRIIGDCAFQSCTSLENVEFGDKLTTIGNKAFNRCFSLSIVKLPKIRVIGDCAFTDCQQLTEVELSEDLETIEGYAFGSCPLLRRIAIPLKDNILGDYVFDDCDNLSQVDLVGGIHHTIASLLLDSWRNEMKDEIDRINHTLPHLLPNSPDEEKTEAIQQWMGRVLQRMTHYKSEHYALLKEAMSLLELALWKANLEDNLGDVVAAREGVRVTRGQRKRARKDRCITSGASVVIKNVLPFLKLE